MDFGIGFCIFLVILLWVVGKIEDKHWSCIITYRGEGVRIISVRRSRKEEIDIYEG